MSFLKILRFALFLIPILGGTSRVFGNDVYTRSGTSIQIQINGTFDQEDINEIKKTLDYFPPSHIANLRWILTRPYDEKNTTTVFPDRIYFNIAGSRSGYNYLHYLSEAVGKQVYDQILSNQERREFLKTGGLRSFSDIYHDWMFWGSEDDIVGAIQDYQKSSKKGSSSKTSLAKLLRVAPTFYDPQTKKLRMYTSRDSSQLNGYSDTSNISLNSQFFILGNFKFQRNKEGQLTDVFYKNGKKPYTTLKPPLAIPQIVLDRIHGQPLGQKKQTSKISSSLMTPLSEHSANVTAYRSLDPSSYNPIAIENNQEHPVFLTH